METVLSKDNNTIKEKSKFGLFFDKIKGDLLFFGILMLIGFGFYFVMLKNNNWSLAYGGDYSSQYIPMGYRVWDYWHECIKTGHLSLWDEVTYLGTSAIGSNAYYGLYSPFNVIIFLAPRSLVPQALAFASMFKIACAGMLFKAYMKYLGVKDRTARICGIAYGFAGWGAFYLWYNNYQDVLVFLPLILLGIEVVLKTRKPWILALGVFLLTISNYVLMVPYVITTFMYAMFRFFQKVTKCTAKENLNKLLFGFIGYFSGLMMGLIIFLPAFVATLDSPKVDGNAYLTALKTSIQNKDILTILRYLFSWKYAPDQHGYKIPERVYYPILEFFFPATTCRSLPTLQMASWDFDDIAVNLYGYVPLILFLVPALITSAKEKRVSHLVGFLLVVLSLFTPVMYYLTMGFTNGYARWTLIIAAIFIAYVGSYIDRIPNVNRNYLHFGLIFAIIGISASVMITYSLASKGGTTHTDFTWRFFEDGKNYTSLCFILEYLYVIAAYLILYFSYNKKQFFGFVTTLVTLEAIVMGNLVTYGHGYDTRYNHGYALNNELYNIVNKLNVDDPSYYRIYTTLNDSRSENNGMMNNYGGTAFFHSLYNFNTNDFKYWADITNVYNSISGHYREKNADIDYRLGTKYYIIEKSASKYNQLREAFPTANVIENVPFGFEVAPEYETDNFVVYKNTAINPLATSYTNLFTPYDEESHLLINTEISNQNVYRDQLFSNGGIVSLNDKEIIQSLSTDLSFEEQYFDSLRYFEDSKLTYYATAEKTVWDESKKTINYPLSDIPHIPTDLIGSSVYTSSNGWHYFSFLTNNDENKNLIDVGDHGGVVVYLSANYTSSIKYDVYFIDENDNIFLFDDHSDDTTDNYAPIRTFYADRNIKSIVVAGVWKDSNPISNTSLFTYEFKDEVMARLVDNDHALNDVIKHNSDKYTFKTNYDTDRFVVTTLAYDKGWSVKAKNLDSGKTSKLKIFHGDGGFVSFIAPKGNYTYTLTYNTPYLNAGMTISFVFTSMFMVTICGYEMIKRKKEIEENLKFIR